MIELLIILGAAAGALTAIGVFLRKLVKTMRQAYRDFRQFLERADASMRIINAEMQANHGGSLLDKVNEIRPNHLKAEAHWKGLREQQEGILTRLNAVEQTVQHHGVVPCIALAELQRKVETMG